MVKTDRRLKMENETPKYATWIPTAGGYVYDGNVVEYIKTVEKIIDAIAYIGNFFNSFGS